MKRSSAAGLINSLPKEERCHLLQTRQMACLLQVNYTGQLFPLKWGIGKIICDVVRSGGRWAALQYRSLESCTALVTGGSALFDAGQGLRGARVVLHWMFCECWAVQSRLGCCLLLLPDSVTVPRQSSRCMVFLSVWGLAQAALLRVICSVDVQRYMSCALCSCLCGALHRQASCCCFTVRLCRCT